MQAHKDRLREQYDFQSWSSPRGDSLLAWQFRLTGDELPGWRPHRIQQVDLPGEPAASLSVWRPASGNGALLAFNVYECDDEADARTYLLRLLGEFQGPSLRRVTAPGDVAFAAGSAGLLFARGNLVALVRSIERTPAPVAENAALLDRMLDADVDRNGDQPRIGALELSTGIRTGQPFPITVTAADPAGGHVWFRFRCGSGRLLLHNGSPAFMPQSDPPHEIVVRAIGPTGVAENTLRLDQLPASD